VTATDFVLWFIRFYYVGSLSEIILPIDLYGCETPPLTLTKKHKFQVETKWPKKYLDLSEDKGVRR
jgi:hypothetical protein